MVDIRGGGGASTGRDTRSHESTLGGGTGMSDQRQRNRLAEIARVGRGTGLSTRPSGNTGVSPAGRAASVLAGMGRDVRNIGNTPVENLGNLFASLLGFNEMRPSMAAAARRAGATPADALLDKRANWGFDPLGLALGLGGTALTGVPLLPGLLGNLLSRQLGRPLNINLGPSVFGNPFERALHSTGVI